MEDKIIEWADKFEKIVAEKMPEAVELGLLYIRVDALSQIVFGIVSGLIAFLCYRNIERMIFKARYKEFKKNLKEQDKDNRIILLSEFESELSLVTEFIDAIDDGETELIIPSIPQIVVIIFCLTMSITYLLDIWNWVAVFSPKLGLVHKLMTTM